MLKFHDGRKNLNLTSHSLQILRNLPPPEHESSTGRQHSVEVAPELVRSHSDMQHASSSHGLSAHEYLHGARDDQQLKSVLMGHISTSNVIYANEDFYSFNVDRIIRSDEPEEQAEFADEM